MRRNDTVCVKCDAPIFWATAGWWLHINWGITCFSPTPKIVSLEKRHANTLPVLPRTDHVREVSFKESSSELATLTNETLHMLGRPALVFREGVADSTTD